MKAKEQRVKDNRRRAKERGGKVTEKDEGEGEK